MDSSSCSYTPDFSDIYDSNEDSNLWYNFGIEKDANTLQEVTSRRREWDSLDLSSPNDQPEKYVLKRENFGDVPHNTYLATTESEANNSEVIPSKESSLNLTNRVLDQEKLCDFLKYSDERIDKIKIFNEIENKVSFSKETGEFPLCKEETLEKGEDEFWDFLKSADESLNAKKCGINFSKTEIPLDEIKNEVAYPSTINAVDTSSCFKEKTLEKDEDEFWDFLKSADALKKNKQRGLKNTSETETNLDTTETVASKIAKTIKERSCSNETTLEKYDEFWDFLKSTDEPVDVESSNFQNTSKETFVHKIGNDASHSKRMEVVDESLHSHKNLREKDKDAFWDFLETDCQLDSEQIKSLKLKLDFKSTSVPVISNNVESKALKSDADMSPGTNETFGNFLQPNCRANSFCNNSKMSHSIKSSGTKVSSEQVSSNTTYSTNSMTAVRSNDLNLRRKINRQNKIRPRAIKDWVFDRNITNRVNALNANKDAVHFTNEELKPSLKNVTSIPSNQRNVSDVESTLKNCDKNPKTNQPIITSFFSIASCPDIFDQPELSFIPSDKPEANFCSNYSSKDGTITVKSADPKKIPESDFICPSENCEKTVFNDSSPSKMKRQNIKRSHPENSPKNSVFKITDYSDIKAEIKLPKEDSLDGKRLKISDPHDENILSQEVPYLQSTCTIPIFFTSTPQMAPSHQVSNLQAPISTTQYIVVPKNLQTSLSQSAERLMLINVDQIETDKSIIKIPINDTKFTVPVIPYTNEINSNLSNVRENITQVSYAPFNVGLNSTIQVTNAPNFNVPTFVYKQPLQVPAREQIPSNIPCPVNKISILPHTMRHGQSQTQFLNTALEPVDTTQLFVSKSALPIVSVIKNVPSSHSNPCFGTFSTLNNESMLTTNVGVISAQSRTTAPLQCLGRTKSAKIKPIKTISIGRDKNAIQQTSYPITLENSSDPRIMLGNKEMSMNLGSRLHQESSNKVTNETNSHKLNSKTNSKPTNILNFVQYKPNTNAFLVEKNLILNTGEIVNRDIFLKTKPNINQNLKQFVVNTSDEKMPTNLNCETNQISSQTVTSDTNYALPLIVQSTAPEFRISDSGNTNSQNSTSQDLKAPVVTVSSKNALDTLKKLFPPPISMIPVCVMQPVPPTNKPAVSKVLVLPSPILPSHETNPGIYKTIAKRTVPKKEARKTVRELLQEKYGNPLESRLRTGCLRLNYGVNVGNKPSAIALPSLSDEFSSQGSTEPKTDFTLSKRPNIMVLPSAAKLNAQTNLSEKMNQNEIEVKDKETTFLSPYAADFTSGSTSFVFPSAERAAVAKDSRPRNYDMCELSVGYFKVEDFVDVSGSFQSKFKVLFTKRQFVYDFPVSKSNQVDDICNSEEWDVFAKIVVSFESIEGMSAFNRRIQLKVNSVPQIFLWKMHKSRPNPSCDAKRGYSSPSENSIWMDVVQNSLVHKVTLRKRQADNLKAHLCQVDPHMLLLFEAGLSLGLSMVDTTPYDEEILSIRLGKLPKNRKNNARRLPQWDSDLSESPLLGGERLLLSSNHVCSCRISCRSLRCSCVKAAKSCNSGGTCMCTACDNPLNVLESLGIDVELSLKDCCLFQNIYQIPKLQIFLERSVKLSCCNTVARVMDCIPSTLLCPNMECNACLEFSWCRGFVCYPERNPRKHCSYCGQCCFSNGRHCLVCNKCYTVTLKRPLCPNCKGDGILMNPTSHDTILEDSFYSTFLSPTEEKLTKPFSKPEIVLLDSSVDAKHEDEFSTCENIVYGRNITEKERLSYNNFLGNNHSPQSHTFISDAKIKSVFESNLDDSIVDSKYTCNSEVDEGNDKNLMTDLTIRKLDNCPTESFTSLLHDSQDSKTEEISISTDNANILCETEFPNPMNMVKNDINAREDKTVTNVSKPEPQNLSGKSIKKAESEILEQQIVAPI